MGKRVADNGEEDNHREHKHIRDWWPSPGTIVSTAESTQPPVADEVADVPLHAAQRPGHDRPIPLVQVVAVPRLPGRDKLRSERARKICAAGHSHEVLDILQLVPFGEAPKNPGLEGGSPDASAREGDTEAHLGAVGTISYRSGRELLPDELPLGLECLHAAHPSVAPGAAHMRSRRLLIRRRGGKALFVVVVIIAIAGRASDIGDLIVGNAVAPQCSGAHRRGRRRHRH